MLLSKISIHLCIMMHYIVEEIFLPFLQAFSTVQNGKQLINPNLGKLFRDSPCLKPVRILLATWNLARKYTTLNLVMSTPFCN